MKRVERRMKWVGGRLKVDQSHNPFHASVHPLRQTVPNRVAALLNVDMRLMSRVERHLNRVG